MENIRGVIEVHSNASLGTLIVEYNPLSVTPQDILREAGIKGEIITLTEE